MWSKLAKQIAVEEAELQELVEFHRELLEQGRRRPLVGIELSAAAAFLHSLYSGIENIFRRIAIELGDGVPQSRNWHQDLLQEMGHRSNARPAVLSGELQGRLKEYLQFRHLFRNLYAFRLEWERMEALVLDAERVLGDLMGDLGAFKEAMDAWDGS